MRKRAEESGRERNRRGGNPRRRDPWLLYANVTANDRLTTIIGVRRHSESRKGGDPSWTINREHAGNTRGACRKDRSIDRSLLVSRVLARLLRARCDTRGVKKSRYEAGKVEHVYSRDYTPSRLQVLQRRGRCEGGGS